MSDLDGLTAVDVGGVTIKIGDSVNLGTGTVIGLRADANNHLNVYIKPRFRTVKTLDPAHPLVGQVDGKAVILSGYNLTVAGVQKPAKDQTEDDLPSNAQLPTP